MAKECAFMIRNRSNENAERLAIADQLRWWRIRASETSDPMKLASYRRIIKDLEDIAVRMESDDAR